MIKAFIFDMDGVLVNSEEMYFYRRMEFFNKIRVIPDSKQISDYLGCSNERVWELLVNDPIRREQLKQQYFDYQKQHPINYKNYINDGVEQFLKTLQKHHITMILASAGARTDIVGMLNDCKIKHYFNLILSGEEVKHNKPAPDIYLEALDKSGLDKQECIVIEDSKYGIQAAKKAGIETWALKPQNYTVDQSQANYVFENFIKLNKKIINENFE
ncbi:MAG: HAD family phosphatase [Lactobacillus sp.]|uniref:HAD family hydrolase n=1 Tax=Bombilactobacillus bombi TaxID=1303590 RepID=UPI0035E94861|nr:HAD family phosphatase [Lactobacillus sp.]